MEVGGKESNGKDRIERWVVIMTKAIGRTASSSSEPLSTRTSDRTDRRRRCEGTTEGVRKIGKHCD